MVATEQRLWRVTVRFDVTPGDWEHGRPEQLARAIVALIDTGRLREINTTRDRLEVVTAVPYDTSGGVLERTQAELKLIAREAFGLRAEPDPKAISP
jgi:hypothetical protein